MSTLTLKETRVIETNLDGIYITNGEKLFFMTAEQDEYPFNPREDYAECTICYVRNRYLGSSQYDDDMDFTDGEALNDYLTELKDRGTEFVSVPLYAYVHSGITISTGSFSDPWDSGCFGVAICTKEQVVNAYGNDTDWQQHAKDIIESEIDTYDKYIRGDVYVYTVCEYDKNSHDWDIIDTCSGYYSDDEDEMFATYFSAKTSRIINESEAEKYL